MIKVHFISLLLLFALHITTSHCEQNISDLQNGFKSACLGTYFASREAQKQAIRARFEQLNKIDPSLAFKSFDYSVLWMIYPEILKFLVEDLNFPAKEFLIKDMSRLSEYNDYHHDSIESSHLFFKNLAFLSNNSKFTESELKDILKLLRHRKITSCKKSMNYSFANRQAVKYSSECIFAKEVEKIFKPMENKNV